MRGIKRSKRLVHQDDLRLHDQRAGDGDALVHAAAQLVRVLRSVLIGIEPNLGDPFAGPFVAFHLRHLEALEAERHIVDHRAVREIRVVLEDKSPVGTRRDDGCTLDQHRSRKSQETVGLGLR